jgi:hypothetical protein
MKRNIKILSILLIFLLEQYLSFAAEVTNIDEKTVESWVSSNRFFSHIQLEVSHNYFLPYAATNFTVEPKEMTLVEGSLLPESFYVKYGSAYREPMIRGASDTDCWSLRVQDSNLVIGSKDPHLGGAKTNWTRLVTTKQQREIRDFTQFGFLFTEAGSLHIFGTNFTAIADITGGKVIGNFSSIDDLGIPHSFRYDFTERGGANLHFEVKFDKLDSKRGNFDCVITHQRDGKLAKIIRIRTVNGLEPAGEGDISRVFRPSDFLQQIKTTIIESNGLQYLLLSSGKLRLISGLADANQKPTSYAAIVVFLIVNIIFLSVIIKSQTRKPKQTTQNK